MQHCLGHFERCDGLEIVTHEDALPILQHTTEAARDFLAMYSLPTPQNPAALSYADITKFFSQLPKDARERASKFTICYRTLSIRKQLEVLHLQDLPTEDVETINNIYGLQVTYKCPKIWCDCFSNGFENEEERTNHVRCHDRPFCCAEEGCFAFQFGFDTQRKLEKHVTQHHMSPDDEIRFPKTQRKDDTLASAARRGDLAAISALLEHPPFAHPKGFRGDPLWQAATHGHVEACKLLLDSGFKLEHYSVGVAVDRGRSDVVHLFLSWPKLEIATRLLSKWIRRACTIGNLNVLKSLLESPRTQSHPIRDSRSETIVWMSTACQGRFTAIVSYLLEAGFSNSVTPEVLIIARNGGREDLISLVEPIVNSIFPPFSRQRAEWLLGHNGIPISSLEPDQLSAFQNQSIPEQQSTIARFLQYVRPTEQELSETEKELSETEEELSETEQQSPEPGLAGLQNGMNSASQEPTTSAPQRPVSASSEGPGGSNHALQDYQMQLMLLEQQNQKRIREGLRRALDNQG